MKKQILSIASLSVAALLISGCASKITTGQENELKSFKAKGVYVEEKSTGTATALGILPGGGSFYTENYGLGIVNLCLWPISVLWDPVSGYNGAESINYHATKQKVETDKKNKIQAIEREMEDNKITKEQYIKQKREIEDFYNTSL